jgi:hypothetical protein
MSDITNRLRDMAGWFERRKYRSGALANEAADLIDKQQAEIKRLRMTLERLCYCCDQIDVVLDEVLRARVALKGEGNE